MNFSFRTVSIVGSLIFAGIVIGAAFVFSGGNPLGLIGANAGVTDDLLKSFAAKDSDNDGLPDWQESLYGTNPNDPHSVDPKLTDKQAVDQGLIKPKYVATPPAETPGATSVEGPSPAANTLTNQFSQYLITQYLTKRGAQPMTKAQIDSFVQDAVTQFFATRQILPAYSAASVTVSQSGAAGLTPYAATIEQTLSNVHIQHAKSELLYFSDAVTKNDPTAIKKLKDIGAAYAQIAQLFVKISPPKEAAAAHLEIANAFAQLGTVITDISTVKDDPVRGMFGLNAYEKTTADLLHGLTDMNNVYKNAGVSIPSGQPGYGFYSLLLSAAPQPAP